MGVFIIIIEVKIMDNYAVMDNYMTYLAQLIIILVILYNIISSRYKHPFELPRIRHFIDISGRRQVLHSDLIDEWIISNPDYDIKNAFDVMFYDWDFKARQYLSGILLWKSHKTKIYTDMYNQILYSNYGCFEFVFVRNQTRYRQQDYQKSAYIVQNEEHSEVLSLSKLLSINASLFDINYETTRQKYNAKNQRRLMTKDLRHSIIIRDNYTCQICGKYMPDEVGLHVDHIQSIKKGGKTVPSNLQVTCDKCNLRKGSRV